MGNLGQIWIKINPTNQHNNELRALQESNIARNEAIPNEEAQTKQPL